MLVKISLVRVSFVKFRNKQTKQGINMTKMIKISLVAAVAVAGFSSTVAAKPLSESIQNTDMSGVIKYQYTNKSTDIAKHAYKADFTFKSKVNDTVTAVIKAGASGTTDDTTGDVKVAGKLQRANFVFNLGGATVIAGKQAIPTPLTGADGTGIVALVPVGPVTLAAAWFTNSNWEADKIAFKGNNIGVLGALGTAGPVNYKLYYIKVSEKGSVFAKDVKKKDVVVAKKGDMFNAGLKTIYVEVSGKIDMFNAGMTYSKGKGAGKLDGLKQSIFKLDLGVDAGVAKVDFNYAKTGKDGAALAVGNNNGADFDHAGLSGGGTKGAKLWHLGVSAPVGPVTVALHYAKSGDMDAAKDGDQSYKATQLNVKYAMSKNFSVSGWTRSAKKNGTKGHTNRIELKYTF
jgi:hypothetical protein